MSTPTLAVEHFQPVDDDIVGEHVPLVHGVVADVVPDAGVDNRIAGLAAEVGVDAAAHFVLDNFAALVVVVAEIVHAVDLLMTEYEFVVSVPVVAVAERGGVVAEEAEVEVDGVVVVVEEAVVVGEAAVMAEMAGVVAHVGDEFVGSVPAVELRHCWEGFLAMS